MTWERFQALLVRYPIATIDGGPGVDVHAFELGIGAIRIGRDEAKCASKLARALSGTLTEQDEVRGRSTRTRSKHRLFIREWVFFGVSGAIERAAVTREDKGERCMSTANDVLDIFRSRRRKRVKDERAS